MSEKAIFDVATLVSVASGTLLVMPLSKYVDACEWLVGHDVYTHELGTGPTTDAIRAALRSQHPDLFDVAIKGKVTPENVEQIIGDLVERFGATREVVRGTAERTKSPLETLADKFPDTPVIVIEATP